MFGFGAPEHPEYPIISFICAAMILLPISSHWKARNVATLSMIAWLFVINFTRFINTLVWANNVIPRWKVWCDITTKLTIGVTIALPAAALCICKYLEEVAAVRTSRFNKTEKRARMKFEALMCFGLPCLVMALHYITQGHRYDLYEDFGCQPTTVITWVALVVLYIPPLVLSLISFVYAGLAIRHFYYRRCDFKRLLQASNSGLTTNRYVRLMLLALTEMIVDTSINCWILSLNFTVWGGITPYTSWTDIHLGFSRIQPYPRVTLPDFVMRTTIATWFIIPLATVLFWSFFAFGQESMAEYRAWWNWIQRKILRRNITPLNRNGPSPPRLDSDVLNRSSKGKPGFLCKLSFPKRTQGNSANFDSSGSSESPATPATPRGRRFELELKGRTRDSTFNSNGFSGGSDGDSFVSADYDKDKPLPISPLSPLGPVGKANAIPASYTDCDLDTSVFDTISHVTIPTINEPTMPARSASPEIQEVPDAYHPSLHGIQGYSPSAPAFHNTAVPRPVTPNNATEEVKVQVNVDVV